MNYRFLLNSLPFVYTYNTRVKSLFRFAQFIGGEIIPIAILTYVISFNTVSLLISENFLKFLGFTLYIFLTFFTMYEIGYIINDCVSIKNESNPSIRFKESSKWYQIVIPKILFFGLLGLGASFLFKINLGLFLLYSLLVMSIFLIHNVIKSKNRIITYFWLELLRLMFLPSLVLYDSQSLMVALLLVSPELLRRSIRYMRLKFQSIDRKFSKFDMLFTFSIVSIVGLFLLGLNAALLPGFILSYSLILSGIAISIKLNG